MQTIVTFSWAWLNMGRSKAKIDWIPILYGNPIDMSCPSGRHTELEVTRNLRGVVVGVGQRAWCHAIPFGWRVTRAG